MMGEVLKQATFGMRAARRIACAAIFTAWAAGAAAQEAFDACQYFTEVEAKMALGDSAEPEPQNPKVKRPRFVNTCTWWSSKEGKSVSASANFRIARSEADLRSAFDEERLTFQTKPLLVEGAPAFWSAKQGVLQVLKGRVWLVVTVGGAKPAERDPEAARRLAEALVKKL
jgi:hypothetical protein